MLKIIVIDDEPTIRKGLVKCINWGEINCTVTGIFTNGYEALESIKISPPDIIITDIRMPRMNGLELAKYLYENDYNCKVIVLTAFPDFNYLQEAIQCGVVDFVIKPTSPQLLVKSVERAKKIIEKEQAFLNTNSLNISSQDALKSKHKLVLLNTINNVYTAKQIKSYLSQHQIYIENFFCILLHADIPYTDDSLERITQIQTYIEQVFIQEQYFLIFIDKSHILLIYLIDKDLSANEAEEKAISSCHELLSLTKAFVKFDITIGISSFYTTPIKLPLAYEESKKVLKYKFNLDSNYIFPYFKYKISNSQYQEEKINNLITDILELNTCSELLKYVTQFFKILSSATFSIDQVYNYTLLLITCLQKLDDNLLASHEQFQDFLQVVSQIHNANSIESLALLVTDYAEHIIDEASSEMIGQDLIEEIDSYLQENFNQDLTLSSIANHFHLNSSYLSRLYKKETNENLITALTKMRIEKAKKSLLTTDKLVYEIAHDVGIHDPTYFSQVFKKYTGINPSEYKDSI